MKFLVTGGAGFIGSNLVERLVKEGHEVTVLDNLHTGSETNLSSVKDKIKFINGNASKISEINEKFDGIFHNGIYSSSPMYRDDLRLIAQVIDEFISILEYARKHNTKVVFASSSSVYSGLMPPHKEDMQIKVTDFYTEARLPLERLAELYNKLYGTKVIGLRYFSVYGPHEESKGQYANLITQFLWAMKKNEAPVIFGDGNQKRDFTYVGDVVEANLLSMNSKVDFGIFNVGTGATYTLNDMCKLLSKKMSKDIKPTYVPNPIKNYVQYTQADTTKAENILGFKAKLTLETGIEKLLVHYG
ncbi:MAG: NAD-dependent epimerase/dehydratase family protein [Candidatus Micrarchaeota archaeon]